MAITVGIIAATAIWTPQTGADESPVLSVDKKVELTAHDHDGYVGLEVRLIDCLEATVTVTAKLDNVTSSVPLPLTVQVNGREPVEVVKLTRANFWKIGNYDYHCTCRLGGNAKIERSAFIYELPYTGAKYEVSQAAMGEFSHYEGSGDEYAIDWRMPVGTTVCAARAGTVIALRQDSTVGGKDKSFASAVNYVVIKHDDGTLGEYLHLKPQSVLVKLGDQVKAHQPLARSGNTGLTTEPHLHFAVYVNIDAQSRRCFPIKFHAKDGAVRELHTGDRL